MRLIFVAAGSNRPSKFADSDGIRLVDLMFSEIIEMSSFVKQFGYTQGVFSVSNNNISVLINALLVDL